MYKLFVTDIDRTLLNDDHKISAKNKSAIRFAIDTGVHVALCSGRSRMSMLKFEEELGLRRDGVFGVGSNGGCVYETASRKVLREVRLHQSTAGKVLDSLKRYDIPTIVFGSETEYAEKRFESSLLLDNYFKITDTKHVWLDDCRDAPEDLLKILILGSNDYLQKIKAELLPVLGIECNIFFSAEQLLEFTDPQVTKGAGVEYLTGLLGIKREEVIAAGDNHNDISMIQWAGTGVAVRNAVPEAKACADYVTVSDNNSDAIAEIVKKFIG